MFFNCCKRFAAQVSDNLLDIETQEMPVLLGQQTFKFVFCLVFVSKWTLSAAAVLHSRKCSCCSCVVKLESLSLQVLTVSTVCIFSNLVSRINWCRRAWLVRVAIIMLPFDLNGKETLSPLGIISWFLHLIRKVT